MFKFLFAIIAVVTLISMGFVGNLGKYKSYKVQAAPVIINSNGTLTFPGRIPSPDTVYDLRRAIEMKDTATLNALLVENHLFVAPRY